jgi:hypothetical protein
VNHSYLNKRTSYSCISRCKSTQEFFITKHFYVSNVLRLGKAQGLLLTSIKQYCVAMQAVVQAIKLPEGLSDAVPPAWPGRIVAPELPKHQGVKVNFTAQFRSLSHIFLSSNLSEDKLLPSILQWQ